MNHRLLLRQLDLVARRYRQLRLWQLLALVWLLAAGLGVAFWGLKPLSANPLPLLCFVAVFGALSALVFVVRYARDPAWVAQRIESTYPELQTCLLAALQLQPDLPDGRYGYLQGQVLVQALRHARTHRWPNIVSAAQLWLAAAANLLCFSLFVATVVALALTPAQQQPASLASSALSGRETILTVEPGDTEVELGSSLLVVARLQGALPREATLAFQSAGGDETQMPMTATLNDAVFGGRIPVVDQPLEYWVALPNQSSPKYRVTVFEYPRLERADARLAYPAYTKLENRVIQDVRTVSVVEGTTLALQCFLNKPVVRAQLVDAQDPAAAPIALSPAAEEPLRYEAAWTCLATRRLKLELLDDAGRANQKAVQFHIHVLPNQPPALKPVFPAKDLEVSPLEEIDLTASVWDDFGATKLGLTYSLNGGEPVDVVVATYLAARQKHEARHTVRLEELSVEPDQLLSYHWWAEDIGPDGQPRRVMGDMYFAEVRPFEEIFRQGEQPPGGAQQQQQQPQNQQGQGQNAQDAQQLAKLQKDIINATWKLVRREVADPLSAGFANDAEQIQLSQEAALEQTAALAQRVQDEQSLEHIEAVQQKMRAAAEHLKQASEKPAREPLRPALAAAQQAYQSLLKLRAREHEVVRQQQSSQRGQPGSQQQSSARSQQQREQLQQLDLRKEENRYETERAAQQRQQESAVERENRQVQNRLRELARRQGDVNERLKELQAALEEAQTEAQKEELRRQLKRLQDEQREILQDTDELQSRLEQPENAERMSDERQQLEETRDQVRRASEALEEQRVGQASAAGARAQQQFEDLREEFRRRAANRFNDEMQEMRQAARQLEQREQKIAEELNQPPAQAQKGQPPMLREDAADREQLAEEIGRQRQRLDDLQERMRSTIGEAETSEPILSQRLYDAVRDAQDRQIERSLQQAERALRQGQTPQAQQQEAAAADGLRRLRESVERAADAVLGDETEALRRAREELRHLSRELNEELQRNGQPAPPQQTGQAAPMRPGERGQNQNELGQRGNDRPMPGGEQQPGPSIQRGGRAMNDSQDQPGEPGRREGNPPSLSENQPGTTGGGGAERMPAPLTGEEFRQWSDRLRDVEEMVEDPDLRAEAARIRERARGIRAEFKRHSQQPNWDLVQQQVAGPLFELQERVAEELLRRTSKKALVPLDRDPVPPQYSEKTRRYYEKLGAGK